MDTKVKKKSNQCLDCGPLPRNHFSKYIESLLEHALPGHTGRMTVWIENAIERACIALGLLRRVPYRASPRISTRSSVFIDEGLRRGWNFFVIEGQFGPTGRFHVEKNRNTYLFEGLPRANFLEDKRSQIIDDKAKIKVVFRDMNIPTPEGKCFGVWRVKSAIAYGKMLGFPLVVKPRSGSISHHVFVNIINEDELARAVRSAFSYEPYIIVERFLPGMKTYRATVVDFSNIAVVERRPAHVVGDGVHTIQELIDIKNTDPRRGKPKQKDTTLYRMVIDGTTERILERANLSLSSVPKKGSSVAIQEKVILDLGADLFEVTNNVHPDNRELFQKVASTFNVRLVGIDFLSADISLSWKEGHAVVIELNSLPYIDMHHFPTEGKPVNVGGFVCDLVEKYYV